ncbi:MAG: hypothetical protein AAFP79_03315 [Pseudomonadota bacterium]
MRLFAATTFLLASATFLWTAPAFAQNTNEETPPSTQSDDPEIIVEAPRTERERRAELREMVADIITKPRAGRTVATYFEAICPKIIGVPEAEGRVIAERISENAAALGVNRRNPRENCKPNLTVIFVPTANGPPEAWLTSDNDMLRHLLSYQRYTVLNDADPVRAWTTNELRTADGTEIPNANGQRIAGALNFGNPLRQVSRFKSDTTVEITGSVIMIELASAVDKTLGQLADYASMRTFGNVRSLDADASPAADTILTLFRSEDAPEALTTFDRALISKMYDTQRNSLANRYYTNIAGRAFEMEKAERGEELEEPS